MVRSALVEPAEQASPAHLAADLAQQALLVTLESARAGRVREPDRLGGFVLGVCRTLLRDQRRETARRREAGA